MSCGMPNSVFNQSRSCSSTYDEATSSKPKPAEFIADITRSASSCTGVPVPPTQLQNRGWMLFVG